MFLTFSRRDLIRKATTVLATLLVLVACLWSGRSLFTTAGEGMDLPLTRAPSIDDRVAITFDVTWGETELRKILAILDQNGVKGTFFVGGSFLSKNGDLIKQMVARGHEVGTMGQKIVDLSVLPETEITSNLLATQSVLSKLLGGPVRYFRPPQGAATPAVVRAARAASLITVTCSLDSQDQTGLKADAIVRRVTGRAHRGDIILLSASDWSPETAKALPKILAGLKERQMKLVKVSELAPEPGTEG